MKKMMKKVFFCILIGMMGVFPAYAEFSDITADTKYKMAIEYLENEYIVEGEKIGETGSRNFYPNREINRAEFLKLLYETFWVHEVEISVEKVDIGNGYDPVSKVDWKDVDGLQYKNCFPDVTEEWYAKYVCYGKEKGWIQGYGDGKFHPENSITLVEALKITLAVFGDQQEEKGKKWYAKTVQKAVEEKIIPFDFFDVNQKVKREQMAEIAWRMILDDVMKEKYTRNQKGCEVTLETLENKIHQEQCLQKIIIIQTPETYERDFLVTPPQKYLPKISTVYVNKNTDTLNLSQLHIQKIEKLENLNNLKILDLGGNDIVDISFLSPLKNNINRLDLRDNPVEKVEELEEFSVLEALNLSLTFVNHEILKKPFFQNLKNFSIFGVQEMRAEEKIKKQKELEEQEQIFFRSIEVIAKTDEEKIKLRKDFYPFFRKTFEENYRIKNPSSSQKTNFYKGNKRKTELKKWAKGDKNEYGTNFYVTFLETQPQPRNVLKIQFNPNNIDITTESGRVAAKKLIEDVSAMAEKEIKENSVLTKDDENELKKPFIGLVEERLDALVYSVPPIHPDVLKELKILEAPSVAYLEESLTPETFVYIHWDEHLSVEAIAGVLQKNPAVKNVVIEALHGMHEKKKGQEGVLNTGLDIYLLELSFLNKKNTSNEYLRKSRKFLRNYSSHFYKYFSNQGILFQNNLYREDVKNFFSWNPKENDFNLGIMSFESDFIFIENVINDSSGGDNIYNQIIEYISDILQSVEDYDPWI